MGRFGLYLACWFAKMEEENAVSGSTDSTDLLSIIRTHMLLGFDELSVPYLPRQCSGIDMINEMKHRSSYKHCDNPEYMI
jgi:hypothetical protein